MPKTYYVYILTNLNHRVLYTGMTNNLKRRVDEHRQGLVAGFTKQYNVKYLVYYEMGEDVNQVILREKLIKGCSRQDKIEMINGFNPGWKDLYDEI